VKEKFGAKQVNKQIKLVDGKDVMRLTGKTGGRTSSKITSFSSSEPGTYDIVKDGKKVGEMYSMRDMDYPKSKCFTKMGSFYRW
jgi:hypothetical protein